MLWILRVQAKRMHELFFRDSGADRSHDFVVIDNSGKCCENRLRRVMLCQVNKSGFYRAERGTRITKTWKFTKVIKCNCKTEKKKKAMLGSRNLYLEPERKGLKLYINPESLGGRTLLFRFLQCL